MQFILVKKVVASKDNKKKFTNLYLKGVDNDVFLPITVKMFKDEDDNIKNKSDYLLAVNLAVEIKENEK